MNTDSDPVDDRSILPSEPEGTDEVVAVSPAVRRILMGGLAIFGGILAVTLLVSIFDSAADEASADQDPVLVATTTTTETSSVDTELSEVVTTTTSTTTTTLVPFDPSESFAEFPTRSRLVLWTFNERRVAILDVDSGSSTELDLTEFGVPLVERVIGVGDRLIVQSLGDYRSIDASGASVSLDAPGVVQVFGDNEIWMTDGFVSDRPLVPVRIDVDGERRLLPEVPAGTFPFGWVDDRLLVGGGRSGGIYIESGDGYELIASGELLASGGGFLLSRVCDQSLICTIARVNLATGETRSYVQPPGFSMTALFWIEQTASPNVDAVLGVSTDLGSPAIWDLLTDEVTPLAIVQGRGAAFSQDGTWVFASVADSIVAYHRITQIEVAMPVPAGVSFASALQLSTMPIASGQ